MMLHAEEMVNHMDLFFSVKVKDVWKFMQDFVDGKLKKIYNFMGQLPPIELVGTMPQGFI